MANARDKRKQANRRDQQQVAAIISAEMRLADRVKDERKLAIAEHMATMPTPNLNETELKDDYPIYAGYLYVADDKVVTSWITTTALHFKHELKATKLCRCDLLGRQEWYEAAAKEYDALQRSK